MEQQIREVAGKHALDVLKRITTGSNTAHFATFELSGPVPAIQAAWPQIEALAPRGMASVQHCNNPDHPSYGKPYICLESVWCEVI